MRPFTLFGYLLIMAIGFTNHANAQNVDRYFDDGLNSELNLFVHSNFAQYLTGHYAISVEKKFRSPIGVGIDLGFVNEQITDRSLVRLEDYDDDYKQPFRSSLLIGGSVTYYFSWFADYATVSLRYRHYSVELDNFEKRKLSAYDMLLGGRVLMRHQIFINYYYGFGVRFAEIDKEGFNPNQQSLVSFEMPIGLGLGVYL